jgi:hypothetical protein
MSKHTPGPWFVADGAMFNDRMPRIATKGPSVAMVCLTGNGTQDANARLLAAAPDLLATLQTIALHAPSLDAQGIRDLCDEAIKAVL